MGKYSRLCLLITLVCFSKTTQPQLAGFSTVVSNLSRFYITVECDIHWICQKSACEKRQFLFYNSTGCKPEQQMMYAGSKTLLVQDAALTKVIISSTDAHFIRCPASGEAIKTKYLRYFCIFFYRFNLKVSTSMWLHNPLLLYVFIFFNPRLEFFLWEPHQKLRKPKHFLETVIGPKQDLDFYLKLLCSRNWIIYDTSCKLTWNGWVINVIANLWRHQNYYILNLISAAFILQGLWNKKHGWLDRAVAEGPTGIFSLILTIHLPASLNCQVSLIATEFSLVLNIHAYAPYYH